MLIRKSPAVLLLLAILFLPLQASASITNYQPVFIPAYDLEGRLKIILRTFHQNDKLHVLMVDPYSLYTACCAASELNYRKPNIQKGENGYSNYTELKKTPYMQLLDRCTVPPYPLQNDGLTHASRKSNGVFLTVDMCPSSRPFEKAFFERLITLSKKQRYPIEVAICISGLWATCHQDEFSWLRKQHRHKKLCITWVNHSFSHPYYPDLPLEKNFMRFHATKLSNEESRLLAQEEVLTIEQLLLEQGETPSIFFRFPGLVSSEALMQCLGTLGLITLGADAWLAKGEQPQQGSVILVHGNGNEKPGIEKMMQLLQNSSYQYLPLSRIGEQREE